MSDLLGIWLVLIGWFVIIVLVAFVFAPLTDVVRGWFAKPLVESTRFATKNDVFHQCVNRLTVKGKKGDLESFRKAATGKDEDREGPLSFESLFPSPFDPSNIALDTSRWGWRLQNWGVACDVVSRWDEPNVTVKVYKRKLVYEFTTDTNPPVSLLLKVSRDFPSLTFTVEYDYIRTEPTDSRPRGKGLFCNGVMSDEYLLKVHFNMRAASLEEILEQKQGVRLVGLFRNRFRVENTRPLGNLTYEEASVYFTEYCELLQEGVGMREKESRLPTSFERMKEALKVECLNWCSHGQPFARSCETIVQGFVRLCNFLPDELIEKASRQRMVEAASTGDTETLRDARKAMASVDELSAQRMREVNIEWNAFVKQYRDKYV